MCDVCGKPATSLAQDVRPAANTRFDESEQRFELAGEPRAGCSDHPVTGRILPLAESSRGGFVRAGAGMGFQDFGPGVRVQLHGSENVIPRKPEPPALRDIRENDFGELGALAVVVAVLVVAGLLGLL